MSPNQALMSVIERKSVNPREVRSLAARCRIRPAVSRHLRRMIKRVRSARELNHEITTLARQLRAYQQLSGRADSLNTWVTVARTLVAVTASGNR